MRAGEESVNRIRGAAEAWNLADTEAWRFIKAFRARKLVERLQFEEEESVITETKTDEFLKACALELAFTLTVRTRFIDEHACVIDSHF